MKRQAPKLILIQGGKRERSNKEIIVCTFIAIAILSIIIICG